MAWAHVQNQCNGPEGVQDNCPSALTGASSALFLLMIQTLFERKCTFLKKADFPPRVHSSEIGEETFDFIVVGAGSAGSVIANRLSEIPNVSVLLLEAGKYPTSDTQVPAEFINTFQTSVDWDFRTERTNTSCLGMQNAQCNWNRGKMLGGSSGLNAMLFVRGNPLDYDEWASINSDQNWSWKNVLRYFKKVENIRYLPLRGNDSDRGQNGLLHTTKYKNANPIQERFISAYTELGYPMNNDEVPIGLFETTMSIDEAGRRESAAKAYLTNGQHPGDESGPNSPPNRENLFMATNAHVMHVLINNEGAYGVKVNIENRTVKVYARNEVILSAGTLNSPQILQLSGIGPKEDLDRLQIPIIKDLPVGKQLMDHMSTWGVIIKMDASASPHVTDTEVLQNAFDYFLEGTGNFANVDTVNLILMNDPHGGSKKAATIQWIPLGFYPKDRFIQTIFSKMGYTNETIDDLIKHNQDSVIYSLNPILLRPYSSGYLELESRNPFEKIKIHTGYFSDRRDMDVWLAALEFAEKVVNTQAFKAVNATLLRYNLPNCNSLVFWSKEYRECMLRNVGATIYHPVRTCRMAPQNIGGVVDSRLRIYGVNKLRVIDASIMTNPPRGNTNAPVLMIAELGSDLIKEDWGYATDTPM